MENAAFLSRYSYGGGKRKSKDSDGEYDPNDAKKLKKKAFLAETIFALRVPNNVFM